MTKLQLEPDHADFRAEPLQRPGHQPDQGESMRILFLHNIFPGPFRWLAHAFGAHSEHTVLFLSETGRKAHLPGVRRLRLAPPLDHVCDDPAEREAVLRFRRGAGQATP